MNAAVLERAAVFLGSWLEYRFGQTTIPGLAVSVSYQGKVVFSQAYGLANVERQEALQTDHLFGVSSQSKMFAAVAVLQLVEAGKVALDMPVCHYLPWLTAHPDAAMQEVTVRQLLSHSAGLSRDLPEADFWHLTQAFPNESALRNTLLQVPLAVEPNTMLKYSNAGYALIGQVVGVASGQAYSSYINQHIIGSLKLAATFADYSPAIANRTVVGYGVPYKQQRMVLSSRQPANALAAVAGIHATNADMCRFAEALCLGNTELLNDASKKEMQRSQWIQTDGYDAGVEFGLGLEIMHVGSRRLIGHSGHLAGHLTATYVDPITQLAVSVSANSKDAPSPKIVTGIFEVFDYFAAHAWQPTPADRAHWNVRLFSPIATVEIVATRDKLVAIDPDDWQPFAYCEELESVDNSTLRIITPGSIFNHAELVRYTRNQHAIQSVTYAGCTLLPQKAYQRALQLQTVTT
jgi:D-alanyl-D-alanine carboxypeptidase